MSVAVVSRGNIAGDRAVNRVVNRAVDRAVNRAVNWVVYRAEDWSENRVGYRKRHSKEYWLVQWIGK